MNAEQFKQWILTEIGAMSDRSRIVEKLKSLGFVYLSEGSYKRVYRHPVHNGFVVKVYFSYADSNEDSQHIPADVSPYFLHPIICTENYLVQEYANEIGGTNNDAFNFFQDKYPDWRRLYDVHHNNVRFHNGRPVIIDFCS